MGKKDDEDPDDLNFNEEEVETIPDIDFDYQDYDDSDDSDFVRQRIKEFNLDQEY